MKAPAGRRIVLGVAITAVVLAVAFGLFLVDPPARQRMRRLDERRAADLRGIGEAVDLFYTRHERMPASLDELSGEPGVNVSAHDPSTAAPYEYRALGGDSYELCAVFTFSTAEEPEWRRGGFWAHSAGRHCFRLEAREVPP